MADLKLGSQIGGNLIWHQGILELNPVDDKLFYRDQEIMTTKGYQTMLGSIKFGTPNNAYDIESLGTEAGAGTKRYLRKMKSGASATIWHETILDNVYTISTGITDAAPQFTITNGNSATFQFPVLTNSPQSGAANSFARKDYVDAVDARNVAKAGDTMTGTLTVPKIVDNNTNIGKDILTYIKLSNVNQWAGPVGQSRFVTPDSVGSPAGNKGGYWNVLSRRDSAGGYAGIFIPYGNSENKNYIGTQELGTNAPIWAEIYTNLNKPTPGDLNAYTKSEVDEKSWIRVRDEREAMIQPSALDARTISAYFTNKSDVSTNWVSGFTVKGWDTTYASWSIFSSSRSDTDDKRLWFKHGRTDWAPSSRIYHENDKPTNVELNLVSRDGDEMTGLLNMKVPDSMGYGKYSIQLNNGSIGGINQLVFNDPSDATSEGIAWPKTGKNSSSETQADYDMLWAFDGKLLFNNKETYGEWNKPTNNDLNLVSRAGDIIKGELEIQNAPLTLTNGMMYVNNGNTKRVIKRLGVQNDAKAMLILIAPKYVGKALPKRGFVGRVTFERGSTGSTLQANYVDISAVTAYTETDAQIHYESGGTPVKLVYHTHTDGIEYLALYRGVVSAATIYIDGYVYGEEPVVISDATGLTFTDLKTRARIYSSDNKPTNVDLNLVSRAGDTITGDLIATNIYSSVTQSTRGDSFARKDYVDTKVGTAVQSVTATGAVKSTGGINPVISLINATNSADGAMSAADKAKLDGLPSAAVNKTGDTMTGNLTFTNNSELVWSRNTDWAKIGFKNDSDADTDSYMWFETGDNKNEYFKFRMHNTTGPKHEVLDIKLEGSTFAHDVILKARESNAVKLTNAQTEYTGNTGVERIIGGITSQWYEDNLVFGHVRSPGQPSAGFGVRLNDAYLMRVTPDRRLATGALVGDSYVAVAKNDRILAMEVDTTTKVPYISVDVKYQAIRFENDRAITMPAGALNVASNVSSGGDVFAKSNVNVTGQYIQFNDKAAGKTAGETGITTARFVEMLTALGAFKTVYWCGKVSWDYAGNNVLTDTGYGNIHLAGCVVEVIGTAQYMIRITTPTITGTSLTGAQNNASKEFIYVNHGSTYAPGWRRGINSLDVRDLNSATSVGDPRNTIPYIKGDGVMEISTFIDMHRKDSTADFDTRLECGSAKQLLVTNSNGTLELGAQNASYAHIYTDRPVFYMNKELQINGARVMYEGSTHGTLTLSNWIRTTGNTGWFNATYGGGIHMEDATWLRAYNGKKFYVANTDGDALNTSGGVYAAGNGNFNDVQVRSDERLKSNFEPILNALDKVDSLSGWIYDKVGKTTREAGIIAQRLKAVLPEATGIAKDSMNPNAIEYLTVSNSGVNALLVEAIKELRAELNELKSKLN
ncbi:short tail fibers protein [Aeromonas phage Ah1]|uniref:Long tail fiber protein Gp37 n=1 Tax=Aeromonas phage Ah1 TaxID=2053701 RepID=A0A2H4YFZ0_9CAUD|nr:tail fiber protein [Aeromonas phage Ah1]AUE22856.1 short tail fibers protein [Aeromonas phage Ah1]